MLLPLETDLTIVEKLSSAKTIAAASFATSVPVIPIAIPISACLRAGASFTPSPVMATILPLSCQALTILILCSGDTLAYTETFSTTSLSLSSLKDSSSCPSIASASFFSIPICFAMAEAVILWSPVIIIGLIPALIQLSTAPFDSSLGGSIIEINPTKISSFSSSKLISFPCSISLYAKDKTLSPLCENSLFIFSISFLSSSVIGLIPSAFSMLVTLLSITSRAPFVVIILLPSKLFTVLISFLSESNGISLNLVYFSLTSNSSKLYIAPRLISAISVGSPISFSLEVTASLHNNAISMSLFSKYWFKSIALFSITLSFTKTF